MNYADQFAASAQQGQASAAGIADERATSRIRQRAQKHVAEINEIAANVEQLANQLFGHPPAPPNATISGGNGGQVEPVRPQIDAIDGAQFLIDEALETLRRQLSRFAAL